MAMALMSLSPEWFYTYDVILELGFAITTLVIGLFALKIYRTTDQTQVRLFGISFLLISFSYFIQSLLNALVATDADSAMCTMLNMQYVDAFGTYGIYAHMLFMTAGLGLLAYMTLRIQKMQVFWLTFAIAIIGIFFGVSPLHSFFLISTMLLTIILWHFLKNYRQTRKATTLLVVLAFGFLLFGSLHFMLSVDHELYYAIGRILELVAYALILANLYLVLHNGKKA